MLRSGVAGPISTSVRVCAKTKINLVGGPDDSQEEASIGSARIEAIFNLKIEKPKGRGPKGMSRPPVELTSLLSRKVQAFKSLKPRSWLWRSVYRHNGILAPSAMAAAKITRSLPAPRQGILSLSRRSLAAFSSPLTSIDYRRKQMRESLARCLSGSLESMPISRPRIWAPYSAHFETLKAPGRVSPWNNLDYGSNASVAATPKN